MTDLPRAMIRDPERVLLAENLSVSFGRNPQYFQAVDRLSLSVNRGETLALVGESGSGKSVTSLALMGLLRQNDAQVSGERWLRRRNGSLFDLGRADQQQLRRIRGADIAMIFQEPMTSLNPVFPVGEQIAESLRLHQGNNAAQARKQACELLERVKIPAAADAMQRFPHQLSGGMRQRVMIAMALSCRPALLIADEPTTALDVTVQAQILNLIRELQQEMHMGVIFITHDMGVVAEMADRVTVMHHGRQVETAPLRQLFVAPRQQYTRELLAAVPALGTMRGQPLPAKFPLPDEGNSALVLQPDTVQRNAPPVLQVRDLVTRFDIRGGWLNRVERQVHAVEHVSFDLYAGETLALVGESGCGKSTTGRSLLKLADSQGGSITFNGQRIDQISGSALAHLRRDIQFIFQDPYASLDPRQTVGFSIMEPLLVHNVMDRAAAAERARELLIKVGLQAAHASRYPHQFSGGQRQRICIARALALNPKVVIADESVSALDVSVQAKIINLMMDLQQEYGIAFLFISHDMAVVERISHRVAVMYLGQIVEIGTRQQVFENPQHPYTRKLMAAVPVADPDAPRHISSTRVAEIPDAIYRRGEAPPPVTLVQVAAQHFVARCTDPIR